MGANLPHCAKNQLAGLTIERRSGIPHQPGFDTDAAGISFEKTAPITVVVAID